MVLNWMSSLLYIINAWHGLTLVTSLRSPTCRPGGKAFSAFSETVGRRLGRTKSSVPSRSFRCFKWTESQSLQMCSADVLKLNECIITYNRVPSVPAGEPSANCAYMYLLFRRIISQAPCSSDFNMFKTPTPLQSAIGSSRRQSTLA